MKPAECTEKCGCENCPYSSMSWQEQETTIIHSGHRVINKYEVCYCSDFKQQFYTGKSKQGYANN